MNTGIKFTRDLFFKYFSLVYMFSFVSLFYQIQGLWGDEGILPANDFIIKIKRKNQINDFNFLNFIQFPCLFIHSDKILDFFKNIPILKNLEFYRSFLEMNEESSSVEILLFIFCLIGIIFSCLTFFNFTYFINPISYFVMWFIFLNFNLIGQDFMNFEADYLIIEMGFLAIFYCPWYNNSKIKDEKSQLGKESTENPVYYSFRFLMFKYFISNTYSKFSSNNFLFQNLNYFGYYLQNQSFPSPPSFYFYYNLDGLKKMLGAFFLINETFVPFFLLLTFWRRFSIIAGLLIIIQNTALVILGNNGYLNILILILNINSFDDEFIVCVVPKFIFKFFDLNVKKEVKVKKPKIISMIENLENIKKKSKPGNLNDETESNNNEEEKDDNIHSNFYNFQEELDLKNSQSSLGFEIMIFFNFICVYLLFLFLYLFPLKDILMNEVKFSTSKVLEFYKKYLIYFCHLVTITFIYHFFKNFISEFIISFVLNDEIIKETIEKIRSENEQHQGKEKDKLKTKGIFFKNIKNGCLNFAKLLKNFFVFLFLIFYLIHSTKIFYKTLNIDYNGDIKIYILEKNFKNALQFSEKFFTNLRVSHNYDVLGEYQSKYQRYELELKFKNTDVSTDKYEYIVKKYGVSSDNNLNLLNLYFPRLDYRIYKSALSENPNNDLYLVILCGKILERNPVTLDLLKYRTRKETNLIILIIEKITEFFFNRNLAEFNYIPNTIKIDKYQYYFTSRNEFAKSGRFFNKHFVNEFLFELDVESINKLNSIYGVPTITKSRIINFSPFLNFQLYDYISLFILIRLLRKILRI